MEPIINPLWFYLIDTVTSLKVVFLVMGIFIWMVLGLVSMGYLFWDFDDFIDFWKDNRTKLISTIVIAAILTIVGCLIPGIETAYKMLVASFVTPDNITAVGESVSSVVDYIIDSVDKLIESKQ